MQNININYRAPEREATQIHNRRRRRRRAFINQLTICAFLCFDFDMQTLTRYPSESRAKRKVGKWIENQYTTVYHKNMRSIENNFGFSLPSSSTQSRGKQKKKY